MSFSILVFMGVLGNRTEGRVSLINSVLGRELREAEIELESKLIIQCYDNL